MKPWKGAPKKESLTEGKKQGWVQDRNPVGMQLVYENQLGSKEKAH